MHTSTIRQERGIKEQELLFSEESLLPDNLPYRHELKPSLNLSTIFSDCHNCIYANEGLLKDKIFHEIVQLLIMKLYDEQNAPETKVQFGITANEYRSILSNIPSSFEERLKRLSIIVGSKYRTLFSNNILKLKPHTLAYVVKRLQYISLTKTPGDIKGEAFQAFIYRHQRGDRGEFFTPYPVVQLAVAMIAPKPGEKVIDHACGSGGFLVQVISYIQQNNPSIDKATYIKEKISGIEFNPDVTLSARLRLSFEGGIGTEIMCANALIENEQLDNSFDIVLTNPPFGSKGKVEDQKILKSYVLARRWNKTQNDGWEVTRNVLAGQSPDILFIERSLKLLRPGGRMAIVLPDGLLQNVSNSHIRFWIRSQAKVLGVVSIPQEAFVPYGTGIKTSLLLLQKLPAHAESVFMAQIQKIGYDVKGQPIYKRDDRERLVKTSCGMNIVDNDIQEIANAYHGFRNGELEVKSAKTYILPELHLISRLDAEHYLPEDHDLLKLLKAIGAKPLGEIADILNEADNFRFLSDSKIKYISISDVDSRIMQVVSQQVIKVHEAPSRATYRVRKGDIITAISGASTGTPRHATALITEEEDGAICSNGFALIRNIHGVEPLFLLAYMRTRHYLRQVKRFMTGHAIPAISTEDLSKVLVPIPLKTTQKNIARSIMSILAANKQTLKKSEEVIKQTEGAVYNGIAWGK